MAVIVLKNADFSANNIGKINIFLGFSDLTKSVFTRYGIVADKENPMQISVDSFINTLDNNNLWGTKIKALCLPFLTNMSSNPNLEDACSNVIVDNEPFFNTNISSLQLYHNGLKPIAGQPRAEIFVNYRGYHRADNSNFHAASFTLEEETVVTYTNPSTGVGSPVDKFIFDFLPRMLGSSITTTNIFMLAPQNRTYCDVNYVNKPIMRIVNYNDSLGDKTGEGYCNGQKVISQNNTLYNSTGDFIAIKFGLYQNGTYGDDTTELTSSSTGTITVPTGLLSVGSYLTSEEAIIYTNAANELIAAVHTYLDEDNSNT